MSKASSLLSLLESETIFHKYATKNPRSKFEVRKKLQEKNPIPLPSPLFEFGTVCVVGRWIRLLLFLFGIVWVRVAGFGSICVVQVRIWFCFSLFSTSVPFLCCCCDVLLRLLDSVSVYVAGFVIHGVLGAFMYFPFGFLMVWSKRNGRRKREVFLYDFWYEFIAGKKWTHVCSWGCSFLAFLILYSEKNCRFRVLEKSVRLQCSWAVCLRPSMIRQPINSDPLGCGWEKNLDGNALGLDWYMDLD